MHIAVWRVVGQIRWLSFIIIQWILWLLLMRYCDINKFNNLYSFLYAFLSVLSKSAPLFHILNKWWEMCENLSGRMVVYLHAWTVNDNLITSRYLSTRTCRSEQMQFAIEFLEHWKFILKYRYFINIVNQFRKSLKAISRWIMRWSRSYLYSLLIECCKWTQFQVNNWVEWLWNVETSCGSKILL